MGDVISLAIIPVAGLGSRLYPMTRILPKVMFPLVATDGSVRPVADFIVQEALGAGVERVCFVTSTGQDRLLRSYFAEDRQLCERIEYITDVAPAGSGYAVWTARAVASGGAVLVLLGDHVYIADEGVPPPARQVAEAFAAHDAVAMVGVRTISEAEVASVGVCRGTNLDGDIYRCTDIEEKPDQAVAADRLVTPDQPGGSYLAHAGIYAFTSQIFDCLHELVSIRGEGAELGLTEAQQVLLTRHQADYLLCHIRAQSHDVGTPMGYLETLAAVAQSPR